LRNGLWCRARARAAGRGASLEPGRRARPRDPYPHAVDHRERAVWQVMVVRQPLPFAMKSKVVVALIRHSGATGAAYRRHRRPRRPRTARTGPRMASHDALGRGGRYDVAERWKCMGKRQERSPPHGDRFARGRGLGGRGRADRSCPR
jgi:hypothetical protein